MKERGHLRDLNVDGNIILLEVLEEKSPTFLLYDMDCIEREKKYGVYTDTQTRSAKRLRGIYRQKDSKVIT
jgi:hypothetical protein